MRYEREFIKQLDKMEQQSYALCLLTEHIAEEIKEAEERTQFMKDLCDSLKESLDEK